MWFDRDEDDSREDDDEYETGPAPGAGERGEEPAGHRAEESDERSGPRADESDERSGDQDSGSRVSVVDEQPPRPGPPPGADQDEYKWHTYRVYPSGRPDAVEFIDCYKSFGRAHILRGYALLMATAAVRSG